MYEEDSALNKLRWLVCHKTKPNQTKSNPIRDLKLIPGSYAIDQTVSENIFLFNIHVYNRSCQCITSHISKEIKS